MKTKDLIIILTIIAISGIGGVLGIYFFYIAPKIVEGHHPCEQMRSQIDVDACYFNLAEETSDAALCERMSDKSAHKGTCFIRVAKQTENSEICERIADEIKKYYCFAAVANDPNMCGKAPDAEARDVCYFEFAIKNQTSSLCEKITDANTKNNCYLNSGP